jgi:ATPase
MEKIEKLVPDTSVIIEGLVSQKLEKKEFEVNEIIIHEAVLAELEHQANAGKATGFLGLDEVKRIREIAEKLNLVVRFVGKRPSGSEIRYATLGEIDALIRQTAYEESATLLTGDKTQARVAEAKGIKTILIIKEKAITVLKLEEFFDENTMSVHLRDEIPPYAKKGMPGSWDLIPIREEKLTQEEIREISKEIIEEARMRTDGFIEVEREGSIIVQLGTYRIVITKPPFADGWEITAVRPVKQLNIEEYELSAKLKERLEKAEGILIAGAPGMGKTTFAQALAVYYSKKKKVVKTIEAPRDLQLGPEITQYALRRGSSEEIHDILLLSRPDYTIFDEMHDTSDFKMYADLRLAGIGLAGVIHATQPIDSIQRFIGRIELGMIPHVIDTVIFIKDGKVAKVFSLRMTVKVPSGMTEDDLARPIVVVNDFETNKSEFEIYTYGEETVVIPVQKESVERGAKNLAAQRIEQEFKKYADEVKVDVVSENKAVVYVPEWAVAGIIGKAGKHIDEIEKRLGISIDIQEISGPRKKKKR